MKRLFALLLLCALMLRSSANAQNADDQYVRIYSLIQDGDSLSDANHPKDALNKYLDAQTNLMHFQRSFPSWNATVVDFRLNYLTGQIAAVRMKLPPETKPTTTATTVATTTATQVSAAQVAQLNSLQTQVGVLQVEKQDLEAKLKEAFAAQPAAVDPRELAKAQDDVRTLQKQNDLLKTSLAQAQAQAAKPAADPKVVAQLKQQLDDSNQKLADATDKANRQAATKASEATAAQEKLAALQADNDKLKASLTDAQASATSAAADSKAVTTLKQQLDESNQKLADARDAASKEATAKTTDAATANDKLAALQKENETLKGSLQSAQANASNSEADTKAIADLKQQLADSNTKLSSATDDASKAATAKAAEAKAANDKLAAMQAENDKLKTSLTAAQASTAASASDSKAIAQLKQQLADSNRKLTDASDKASKLTAVSEKETASSQQKLAAIQAENDKLKASLTEAQATVSSSAVDSKTMAQLKQQLADSNRKLTDATDKASKLSAANEKLTALQGENDSLKANLKKAQAVAVTTGDTKEVESLKQQLADSNLKLATVQHQPAPAPLINTNADNVLRAENDVLKKQLAAIQAPDTNASPADVGQQLVQTRTQLAALQSDTEILKLENMALANRAEAAGTNSPVSTAAIVAPAPVSSNTKITQLTKERDDLQKKLDATKKQLKGGVAGTNTAIAETEAPVGNAAEVQSMKSQLDVLQATAVPYTPEELALFKAPPTALSTNATTPAVDSVQLLADARDAFAAGQFDKAHDDYVQVLQTDPRNEFVLANLAAIEVELGKVDDADKHIQMAVSLAPSDSYNLTVLGNLRLHQGRYDDALIALSRAAQLSPQNPEIQNYLGVTLSHKGLRAQAETALRKAIQLDPKYGGAHNNLAVIYLSQNPPYVELARWHYQKALAAGFPHNPELEKQLDAQPATTTQ